MEKRARQFVGSFVLTGILVLAVCGFILVDLSTQRYMPGNVGPMLAVTSIGSEGIDFSFMGEYYCVGSAPVTTTLEFLEQYKGLAPTGPCLAAKLAGAAHRQFPVPRAAGRPQQTQEAYDETILD